MDSAFSERPALVRRRNVVFQNSGTFFACSPQIPYIFHHELVRDAELMTETLLDAGYDGCIDYTSDYYTILYMDS